METTVTIGKDSVIIASAGRVFRGLKELKQTRSSRGYMKCRVNGKNVAIHRLVAQAFIPNPLNLPEVNHLDGNKGNNEYLNLEWITHADNIAHSYKIGIRGPNRNMGQRSGPFGQRGIAHPHSIPVQATKDGEVLRFGSMEEAERAGFNSGKISLCCSGKRKRHRGYNWMPLPKPPEALSSLPPAPGDGK